MPSIRIRPALALAMSALALAAVLFAGCSEETTEPAPTGPASAEIGPDGGTLESSGGNATLTVPAGALAATTELTLEKLTGDDVPAEMTARGVDTAWRIGPEGTAFAAPVEIGFVVEDGTKDLELGAWSGVVVHDSELVTTGFSRVYMTRTSTMLSTSVESARVVGGFQLVGATAQVDGVPGLVECDDEFRVQLGFANLGSVLQSCTVTWYDDTNLDPDNALVLEELGAEDVELGVVSGQTILSHDWGAYYCSPYKDDSPDKDYAAWLDGAFYLENVVTVLPSLNEGTDLAIAFEIDTTCAACQHDIGDFLGVVSSAIERPEGLGLVRSGFAGILLVGAMLLAMAGANGLGFMNGSTGQTMLSAFIVANYAFWGLLTLSVPQLRKDGATTYTDAIMEFGPNGAGITQYYPDDPEPGWGWTQLIEHQYPVYDAVKFADETADVGAVYTNGQDVGVIAWDAEGSYFTGVPEAGLAWDQFPGREAGFISAFSTAIDAPVLVVEDGAPGRVWLHARDGNPASIVGAVGNNPRRVRADGGIAAVSNYGDGTLTILTWTGTTAAVAGTVAVGAGPIGIDVLDLGGGTVGIVSTGYGDDTYTVTVVNAADGSVVSNTTTAAPGGCTGPGHAIWVRDGSRRIVFTCNGSDQVVTAESGL